MIFKPNPGPQTEFLAATEREVLYGGPLAPETIVVTSEGKRRLDTIKVGDKVLTPYGYFTKVVDIPFIGVEESYEITFSNGHKVIASEGHEWSVSTGDWSKTQTPYRKRITKDLLNFKLPRGRNRYFVEPAEPFEFEKRYHLIPPYLMGVLLADGCITKCVKIVNPDQEIVERASRGLHEDYHLRAAGTLDHHLVKKTKKGFPNESIYRDELRRLELYGKNAFEKRIPHEYLFDSITNRTDLLHGLMDCDGSCRRPGQGRRSAEAKYTTVSESLKEDVIFLAESLGFTTTCYTEVIESGSLAYRILINGGDINPFWFSRKAANYASFSTPKNRVAIVDVKSVGPREVRCITVEDHNHKFILDRFITTFNCAGGGKSYAMLADPVRYFTNPNFRGVLFRRSNDELRELIQKSQQIYPKAIPDMKWTERDKTWVNQRTGATFWMTYLDRDDDVMRYQGQAFSFVGWDELTQWPSPYAYNYMRSRLRVTKDSNLPLTVRSTTNPGGPGHCLPYGEVLTNKGWVDIKEVKAGDTVLSVKKSGEIFYTKATDTVKEFYRGYMVKREGRGLNLEFTENHRLPYKLQEGFEIRPYNEMPGQINVLRAGELFIGCQAPEFFEVPIVECRKTRLNQPKKIAYKDYVELLGWFLSEGHTLDRDKEFGISQIKQPHRDNIRNLLDRCGFSYRESSIGFQVSCPHWYNYFQQFGKCRDKHIPEGVLNGPYLDVLFKAFMDGDGHWQSEKSGTYYTISKRLSDQIQELAIKLGYSVWVSSRQRKDRDGECYQINFSARKTTEILTGQHVYSVDTHTKRGPNVTKTYFEGEVYCITVPETEVFFVRQKGCVWLSGNTWVKKMFIDPAPPNTPFWATDIETGKVLTWPEGHSKSGQPLFKRRFIPATLFDNPYLAEDGNYEANLLSLPEHQRRQLLYGDWDINEGAAFSEFNRSIHVIEPFEIPGDWVRFRACDYGYGSYSAVLWFAVAPSGQLVVYRELYVSKVEAEDLAEMILELEAGEKIYYGVLDSSLWHKRGDRGPSLAEKMIRKGCRWRPSDRSRGSRIAGKNEIHRRLKVDTYTQEPGVVFFSTCTNLISQLPAIPLDKHNPEDVDTKCEDHAYDALRYGVMTRARPTFWESGPDRSGFQKKPVCEIFGY